MEVIMQLKRYRFVLVLAVLLVAGLLVAAFWLHPLTRYQTYHAASRFYDALIKGDYAQAFDHLAYYDRYSDLMPEISRTEAKSIWTERVDALREAEVYLVDMAALEVHFDDGYPVGTARVTVMDRGEAVTVVQQIHFVERAGSWMVQEVSPDPDVSAAAITQISQAISGLVKPIND